MFYLLVDRDDAFAELCQRAGALHQATFMTTTRLCQAKKLIKAHQFDGIIVGGMASDGEGWSFYEELDQSTEMNAKLAYLPKRDQELKEASFVASQPLSDDKLTQMFRYLNIIDESVSLSFVEILDAGYEEGIDEKIRLIESLVEAAIEDPSKDNLMKLRDDIHKIAGSAGAFGYQKVSKLCKECEIELDEVLSRPDSIDQQWLKSLRDPFLVEFADAFQQK